MIDNRTTARIACLLALVCLPTFAWAAPTPQALSEQLAEHAEPCGRFEQSRHLADLDTTLESRGIFRRDGERLIWETQSPIEDRVVLGPDNPELPPQLQTILPIFDGLLAGNWQALSRHFTLHLEGTLSAWHADLAPKDAAVRSRLTRLAVGGGQQVETIKLDFDNGDALTLSLSPHECATTGPAGASSHDADGKYVDGKSP